MLIYRLIGARPKSERHSWTALEYGLLVSALVGIVGMGVGLAGRF